MKTIAVIQARMSSTRLPGKVMLDLAGQPVIRRVHDRAAAIPGVSAVVVATSTAPADDALAAYCASAGLAIFRGSEQDVLDRFYRAALPFQPDLVLRITADCPLLDPRESGRVLDALLAAPAAAYASNVAPPFLPDGLDTEAMRFPALEQAWREAASPREREHVTPFLRENPDRFPAVAVTPDRQLAHHRWTLDCPEDYDLLRRITAELHRLGQAGSLDEVLDLLSRHPEWTALNASVQRNAGARNTGAGQALYKRAKTLIPGGTQLLSKRPEMYLPDQWPAYYSRASGCRVWDLDGREFLDFTNNGVGACTLGYADPVVNEAVHRAVDAGTACTLNPPEEVELAELLTELHPWAGRCRFTRGGGESMAVAVRVARAHTRRDVVVFCGYHGWHDWYLAANRGQGDHLKGLLLPGLSPSGVPASLAGSAEVFHQNRLDELEQALLRNQGRVAAIVAEPQRYARPAPDFLPGLRRLADQHGAVLVFDEVTSAFRLTTGGIHPLYGVEPDLCVLAKALGNGYPIGAVIGRPGVMEACQESFISSTSWTERVGPVAAVATIRRHRELDAPARLVRAGTRVRAIWESAAAAAGVPIRLNSPDMPPLASFAFDAPEPLVLKTLWTQVMLEQGVLDACGCYATCGHTDEALDQYEPLARRGFLLLAEALAAGDAAARLKGPVAHSGFSRLTS